jgi:hypothetical protein
MAEVIPFPAQPKGCSNTSPTAYADDLSFMKKLSRSERKGKLYGIDYWDVKPSGNHDNDWSQGKKYAHELLSYVAAHPTYGHLYLFSHTVAFIHDRAAEEGRRLNGVELGFIKAVGIHAVMATAAGIPDQGL